MDSYYCKLCLLLKLPINDQLHTKCIVSLTKIYIECTLELMPIKSEGRLSETNFFSIFTASEIIP